MANAWYREVPRPLTWEGCREAWSLGEVVRLDWRSVGALRDVPLPQGWAYIVSPEVLTRPVVVGPTHAGRLLAFSSRSLNAALRVWDAYDLGAMASPQWYVRWLNGVSSGQFNGYPSPYGVRGITLMDCGDFQVLFCPEVLGPLGRIDRNGSLVFSEELDVRYGHDGLFLRGPQLPDGYWNAGAIVPAPSDGGWWFLSLREDLRHWSPMPS